MDERLNISDCANNIADALHHAGKKGILHKIGIDDIRSAVIGYLAAGPHVLTEHDTERLIEATLRKTVEKVG